MEDLKDWFIVPSVSSFDLMNNNSTEGVEEIHVNSNDEENSSESSLSENDSISSREEEVGKNCFCASHRVKDDAVKMFSASNKVLLVKGLAEKTRSSDLKTLFSKYGKVSSAKIVTNAKTPGTCYYGFITMASSEEALACIEKLNHTEIHGSVITIVNTTVEPRGSIKRSDLKSMQIEQPSTKCEKSTESPEGMASILSQVPNLVKNASGAQCSNSQLFNESPQKFNTCLKAENIPSKQDVLQEMPDGSINELKDTLNTDFSNASDHRKLDKNTDKSDRKSQKQDPFSCSPFFLGNKKIDIAMQLYCIISVLVIVNFKDILPKPQMSQDTDVTSMNLQRENFLLKKQILNNKRKENRKLTALSNLISIKFEEKENVTRKYLQQLEREALYLKEINSLKEKMTNLEAKCKILQNQIAKSNSIVEKTGENSVKLLDSSSNNEKCVKSKLYKETEPLLLELANLLICISVTSLPILFYAAIRKTKKSQ